MASFSATPLLEALRRWAPAPRYWVAYSGGVDSHALLHAMRGLGAELPGAVRAIHVDHRIHPASGDWARHCETVCRDLGVPFALRRVDARPGRGASPEAAARRLRYEALRAELGDGDMLLTAHQQDDQAETLLLQLCRGAGPAGLSSMPALRRFGHGWHARPLLAFTRRALLEYAERHALRWIEDDSNADPRFDRNFLRREIMPRLEHRRPGLGAVLARAAAIQADAAVLLAELAEADLAAAGAGDALDIGRLAGHSPARRFNLIREWLRRRGLRLPDAATLHRIQTEVIDARADARPRLAWPGVEVRRYRNLLYAAAPLAPHDPRRVLAWRLDAACDLPDGTLTAERVRGNGIRCSACPDGSVRVRFRSGGERLRPAGSAHHRELKALLQERGVPPWLRDRVPLLYVGDRLASVADYCVDAAFSAAPDEDAWRVRWTRAGPAAGQG